MPTATPEQSGFRRTVFYIEGFDPRGPSHYYSIYRDEAAKQARVNGLTVTVGPRRKIDPVSSGWTVSSAEAETRYVFLRYDDIIRAHWPKSGPAVLRGILRYSWAYLRRGVFAAMFTRSRPIFYFAIMAPALVLIAALLSAFAGAAAGLLLHWSLGFGVSMALFAGLTMLQPRFDSAVGAFWLARNGAFAADLADGIPEMDARIDAFAERIASEARAGATAEVLVVGHSFGCLIAASACARALTRMGGAQGGISLLTLGQAIPMVSVQPGAAGLRSELAQAAGDPRLTWVDVSAPSDAMCFALTDPLAASGLRQAVPADPKPKLLSARYVKLFTPETYVPMKRDYYRHHFQYLMAAELPGEYDYFQITAGHMTLAGRYAHRGALTDIDRSRTQRK